MSEKCAVLAAGGTGGHMFPAEALARVLQTRGWRIVLASDARGDQYATQFPCEARLSLDAATFGPRDPIGMVRAGVRISRGVMGAMTAFRSLNPNVVVGFGGYPAFPALVAARLAGLASVIHEQNAVLGRVNRVMAPGASRVACAFPTLRRASPDVQGRVRVVGNPVRPDIVALYPHPYAPPEQEIEILVTGGSQGARRLSQAVPDAMAFLPEDLRLRLKIVQQTRPETADYARQTYAKFGVAAELAPFFRNMAERLSSAHLVIGRAGASTVSELAMAGRPAILAPLKTAMDDHQTENARLLTDCGAAIAIADDHLSGESLAKALSEMVATPQGLARRAALAHGAAIVDSAERLADLVEEAALHPQKA